MEGYRRHFRTAEYMLRDKGLKPVNPALIGDILQAVLPFQIGYEDYMALDVQLLKMCDAIYMLREYEKSEGAKRELQIATKAGIKIFYEDKEKRS